MIHLFFCNSVIQMVRRLIWSFIDLMYLFKRESNGNKRKFMLALTNKNRVHYQFYIKGDISVASFQILNSNSAWIPDLPTWFFLFDDKSAIEKLQGEYLPSFLKRLQNEK